ncbi:hypothetical protein [Endozoicomonas sp. Mp262]|uniref:hypothetical protein n=1 Tax=Endozoicomonas sp. Mp262 TaxID=2919499 RepID=UPI0021DA1626
MADPITNACEQKMVFTLNYLQAHSKGYEKSSALRHKVFKDEAGWGKSFTHWY